MQTVSKKIPFINKKQFEKRLKGLNVISLLPCTPDQTDTYQWFRVVYWD